MQLRESAFLPDARRAPLPAVWDVSEVLSPAMSRQVFGSKNVSETRRLTFDFQLAVGETISAASVSAAVYSGDSAASLSCGSATIDSFRVTSAASGGIAGTSFIVTCAATTSVGQVLRKIGYLVVVAA